MPRHGEPREQIRRDLARALKRVGKDLRAKLERAMGNPPDPSKVPPALWAEFEAELKKETEEALALAYLLAFTGMRGTLSATDRTRIANDPTTPEFDGTIADSVARDRARVFADKRAAEVARGIADNSRQRFELAARGAGDADGVQIRTDIALPPEEIEDITEKTFGDGRAEGIGKTETTEGITSGEGGFKGVLEDESLLTIEATWRHHAHRPPGHSRAPVRPCPICSPLEQLKQNEWPPEFQTGPPAHPNCDCHLEFTVITQAEAKNRPITGGGTLGQN